MNREIASKLAQRFSEPSSWAGIAGMATMVGINVAPGVAQGIAFIGAGVACVAAFFLKEKAQ
jgi:hypothetical protein